LAIQAREHARPAPSFTDVIAVVRDYVATVRVPLPVLDRPSKRAAALAALVGSAAALLCIDAFVGGLLGRALLVVPLVGITAAGVALWLAKPTAGPALSATREAALRAELEALADSRVALVIRQFEWAVNDVERLRQTVRRAEAATLAADKRATGLELRNGQFRSMVEQAQAQLAAYRAEPIGVPPAAPVAEAPHTLAMRWSLHEDGAMRWVHLETDDAGVSRVRLLDPDSHLLTISDQAEPASPRSDGPLAFVLAMSVPPEAIAELETATLTHRFEALVAAEWRPVTLSDSGIRTETSRDKRGRFYAAEGIRSIA